MAKVSVELNFFYMHYNDAKTFASWAKSQRDGDINPSIYVRHAIISVVFASEALINRVLTELSNDPNVFELLERGSILDKWYLAPLLCGSGASQTSFDKSSEPFQSFKELIQIRNWLAHPKVDNLIDAELDANSTIAIGESNEEYPWLEVLKGQKWPQTRIPRNPFELTEQHAQLAIKKLDLMVEALRSLVGGKWHDGWIDLITVKDADGIHNYKAPVHSIWGGYGGPSS